MLTRYCNMKYATKMVVLITVKLGMLMLHGNAHARKYECDAVSSKALLGATYWDVVVISADESDKVCKFSVNGVSAGSPPQDVLFNAYTNLMGSSNGSGVIQSRPGEADMGFMVEMLATLILAAGPDTNADVVSKLILSDPDVIEDCLQSFEANEKYRNGGDVECGVASWNLLQGEWYIAGPFTIVFNENENKELPTFILTVKRGDTWNLLAIPKRS